MTLAPYIEGLRDELEAVAADLPTAQDDEALGLVLAQLGDGLRAGLPIPPPLRDWMCNAARADGMDNVLREAREQLDATLVPARADTSLLDTAVLAREGVESLVVAVRYASGLTDQVPEARFAEWFPLRGSIRAFDESLAAHVSRHDVEQALGQARALHRSTSWAGMLSEPKSTVADAPDAPSPGPIPAAAPSDEVLARYVASGAHATWVEAHAAIDPHFRVELREVIDMLRIAGEPVAFVARRWKAVDAGDDTSDGGAAAPVIRLTLPGLAQAAASDESETALHRIALGVLHPTAVQALLEVFPATVRLTFFGEPGELRSATLGDHSVEAEANEDQVTLEANLAEGPWPLTVENQRGQRFTVTLELPPKE